MYAQNPCYAYILCSIIIETRPQKGHHRRALQEIHLSPIYLRLSGRAQRVLANAIYFGEREAKRFNKIS